MAFPSTDALPYPTICIGGLSFSLFADSPGGIAQAKRAAAWHRNFSADQPTDEIRIVARRDGKLIVTLIDHDAESCLHLAAPPMRDMQIAAI